ncbi:sulfuric ester hydrolase [Aureococcus anophagefferens]|nr:sulfuric ester hydrolase [Aureococcus anophagefferens]
MRPLLRQLLLLALTTPTTTQQQPQRYGVYVQSDSRAPSEVAPAKRNESWWWASAALTARQAARHGDRYVHYRVPPTGCVAADGLTELTAPWCKVAARTPGFGDESRPVALSRDGHGHWCVTLWKRRKLLPHHWDACLNAGVIIWRRDVLGRARDFFERCPSSSISKFGRDVPNRWSISTQAATCCDHFPDAHRVWPWEQTGLQYVAADGKDVAAAVPSTSPPTRGAALVWPPKIRYKACPVPWCLSAVPGACCVVDHRAGRRDKFAPRARERAHAAPASAALRLVDRRVNATGATLRGRGARTGMIDH